MLTLTMFIQCGLVAIFGGIWYATLYNSVTLGAFFAGFLFSIASWVVHLIHSYVVHLTNEGIPF